MWVVMKCVLSPKLGAGEVELFWQGPDDALHSRWTWNEEDAARFGTMAAAESAITERLGDDWPRLRKVWKIRIRLLTPEPTALF